MTQLPNGLMPVSPKTIILESTYFNYISNKDSIYFAVKDFYTFFFFLLLDAQYSQLNAMHIAHTGIESPFNEHTFNKLLFL